MWKSCREHAGKIQKSFILLVLLILTSELFGQATAVDSPQNRVDSDWIAEKLDGFLRLYRNLHAHPELSFKEEKTAGRIAAELDEMGVEVTSNVGGHGVVGCLLYTSPSPRDLSTSRMPSSA